MQKKEVLSENKGEELLIFVGGLSSSVTNQDLYTYFLQFGSIKRCDIQVWKNNPEKCRGFAIVEPAERETFVKILRGQHRLKGRPIECKKLIKDKDLLNSYSQELVERKIFVSGLSKSVDDQTLKDFFSQFGPVEIAYIIKHHKDSKSKGFGFVSFFNKEDKERALSHKDLEINNKVIHCSSYCSKSEKSSGSNCGSTTVGQSTNPTTVSLGGKSIGIYLQEEKPLPSDKDSSYAQDICHKKPILFTAERPERVSEYVFRRMKTPLWTQINIQPEESKVAAPGPMAMQKSVASSHSSANEGSKKRQSSIFNLFTGVKVPASFSARSQRPPTMI